jgi:hypothetical protein
MLDSRVREHVQTSLQGIAKKARQDGKYRFCDAYRLINEEMLLVAWSEINKNAASGVDRVTAAEYEESLIENIRDLGQAVEGEAVQGEIGAAGVYTESRRTATTVGRSGSGREACAIGSGEDLERYLRAGPSSMQLWVPAEAWSPGCGERYHRYAVLGKVHLHSGGRCEGEAYLCRYADDFVCAFRYKADATGFTKL